MRRALKISLSVLVAVTGYLGFEGVLLRQEAAAFRDGRYEEAARLVGPVSVLRRTLTEQLREQLMELDHQGAIAPQLPLLEKLNALAPDPELADRLATTRLLTAPADQLAFKEAKVTYAADAPAPAEQMGPAQPESPNAYFKATEVPGKETPFGALQRLAHRAPDGTWLEMGEGFDGPLGASFELQDDGTTLYNAGDAGIERWDLTSDQMTELATVGAPQFVSAQPHGTALAYTVASDAGDALYVLEDGKSRRVYPAEGAPLSPWLGFSWAPDGRSLLAKWQDESATGSGATHLVWLKPDGALLMEATLADSLTELEPDWLASPDGKRMLLCAGDGAWVWTAGTAEPVPLPRLGQVLGWSPDGRLLAGLDGNSVFVLEADHPERRADHELPGLPPVFLDQPEKFEWRRDRLHFAGRAGAKDTGPFQAATVDLTLTLKQQSDRQ